VLRGSIAVARPLKSRVACDQSLATSRIARLRLNGFHSVSMLRADKSMSIFKRFSKFKAADKSDPAMDVILDKETTEDPGIEDDEDDYVDMFNEETGEWNGPRGKEPTTYGDWQQKGRVSDF